MKICVIGLGSMGRRRIRNLQALGMSEIRGVDILESRRLEAEQIYGIPTHSSLDEVLEGQLAEVYIISTPPNKHMEYAYILNELGFPCFIEASVVDHEKISTLAKLSKERNVLVVPSCTMKFYFGPKKLAEILKENKIGKIFTINYQTGQYLEDWHPWERIQDYYVSIRETGGAREIVPFELTWLNSIFGKPKVLNSYKLKLSNLPADIDDCYFALLQYESGAILNLNVEVLSRPNASRRLEILGAEGRIIFDGENNLVQVSTVTNPSWKEFRLDEGSVELGYINPEEPYVEEISLFLEAVTQNKSELFPNTLEEDYEILKCLEAIELKAKTK
jgi:predicted dehydrogenase